MPSPFPGMDPYLEAQGLWEGFHAMLVSCCAESLNRDLPDSYVAQVETRVSLVSYGIPSSARIPDVLIGQMRDAPSSSMSKETSAIATVEPVTIPLAKREFEVRERWIEISRLPGLELVSVIEVLSPTNKAGMGREDYLSKRDSLIDQPVNLVEIDLLMTGGRMPMEKRLPAGDYYAVVARAERRPQAEVYAWSVRQSLPVLPIPLRQPDPDVALNLADVIKLTYDRGRYRLITRYGVPLPVNFPIAAADRIWVESLAAP
jgi:Protein of unknown function (DUF4058)